MEDTLEDNNCFGVYNDLERECRNNVEYFRNDTSDKGRHLSKILNEWIDNVRLCKESVREIKTFMSDYDFDNKTPGNGYRSFVRVAEACTTHGLHICKNLSHNRGKILFRKGYYLKEIESCNALQASLKTCLDYMFLLRESSDAGDLFAKDNVETLFEKGEIINQCSFYGRCLGFQYRKTIQSVLRFISIAMAGFSESYYSHGNRITKTTNSMWTGGKYIFNPELRAKQIVNISQNATIDFCKSFWFLTESQLMHAIPKLVGSTVKINTVINIEPQNIALESQSEMGKMIEIKPPTIHLGPGSVPVRLLSAERYERMIGVSNKNKHLESSDNLLFHCHGGGFVAQSSKSHELYLRDWAAAIKAPILSVDYSLAPEAPFPRALDEVFYAYCWALQNAEKLGWSGKNIVVAGDSAGANLVLGVTLKCVQLDIRKPDGIFLSYCPTLVNFIPSPARLLCLMDPVLPFGFMMRCLHAYACPSSADAEEKIDQGVDLINQSDPDLGCCSEVGKIRKKSKSESDIKLNKLSELEMISESQKAASASINNIVGAKVSKSSNKNRLLSASTMQNNKANFKKIDALISRTHRNEFLFEVPKDPLLSPFYTDDKHLVQYPRTKILTVDMDPCLDDCVMFAKKLRKLNVNVSLDILEGLPHGFLNFTMMSSEAMEGSKICASCIVKIFDECNQEKS